MGDGDVYKDFWLSRTAVEGPRAARFHGDHDAYDLAAIAEHGRGDAQRLLDLGCGTCVIPNLIVDRLGWSVHAVDYVAEFLTHAIDDPRLTTEVGDVRTYRGPDDAYDMVTLLGVINYLEPGERRDLYERCRATLRAGGVLLVKAQMGVHETVVVDTVSDQVGGRYRAKYPHLDGEVAILREVFGDDAVTVTDPYPASFSRFDNTHFHHLVARAA
ncbi:MAG: Methyltransferase domain protein [Conexibacter sp.]|nr:Methyltransferase domain protein [Conexibacter sp.]